VEHAREPDPIGPGRSVSRVVRVRGSRRRPVAGVAVVRSTSSRFLPRGPWYSALHDVLLADLFGLTQVDHLVRGPDCILVIETKRYGGHITGSLRGDVWVQHLAGGEVRYSFRNPIRQNHRHCRAVEAVLAGLDVPVGGYVVSAGSATFCAELAAVVVPLGRLAAMFDAAPPRAYTPAHLEIAWDRLATAAAAAQHRREEHGEAMCRRRDEVDRIEW
ncbi:MAG: hypothetical protein JWQ55_74, partial [Rhodopila sp.]|nr:hypothetical protein [Rhodopila sp.]